MGCVGTNIVAAKDRPTAAEWLLLNLEAIMKIELLLNITDDSGVCQSIALGTTDMNATPSIAALGLSLADGKAFLAQLQTQVVAGQIAAINARQRTCPVCQSPRRIKVNTTS